MSRTADVFNPELLRVAEHFISPPKRAFVPTAAADPAQQGGGMMPPGGAPAPGGAPPGAPGAPPPGDFAPPPPSGSLALPPDQMAQAMSPPPANLPPGVGQQAPAAGQKVKAEDMMPSLFSEVQLLRKLILGLYDQAGKAVPTDVLQPENQAMVPGAASGPAGGGPPDPAMAADPAAAAPPGGDPSLGGLAGGGLPPKMAGIPPLDLDQAIAAVEVLLRTGSPHVTVPGNPALPLPAQTAA